MKRSWGIVPAMALVCVLLVGCSSDDEQHSQRVDNSPSVTQSGDHSPRESANNDAYQGGGAGGTNDVDNDGQPESSAHPSAHPSDRVSVGPLDDIGDAAGDLIGGAGDAVRDVGDAIGDAANDADRALGH